MLYQDAASCEVSYISAGFPRVQARCPPAHPRRRAHARVLNDLVELYARKRVRRRSRELAML